LCIHVEERKRNRSAIRLLIRFITRGCSATVNKKKPSQFLRRFFLVMHRVCLCRDYWIFDPAGWFFLYKYSPFFPCCRDCFCSPALGRSIPFACFVCSPDFLMIS